MTLSAGDWIEVRSKEEILATLDANGRLEGLPFMPQMFKWCGQRLQVYKRAHKTCDTVSGNYVGRRLPHGVHLDLRCDGAAYGGCQAQCLIFWKEAWLKPVGSNDTASPAPGPTPLTVFPACTERAVWDATKAADQSPGKGIKYACQATEILDYTQPLKWWDARQYVEDIISRNISPTRMLHSFLYFFYVKFTVARRPKAGRPARWIYDRFQSLSGGVPFPRRGGYLKVGKDAPVVDLQLQPGDFVRVRPHQEILATVDEKTYNRGLGFDAELVPYCGKIFRVQTRVEKFVDERTGYMRYMKTPAVILEGVFCQSRYSEQRVFCPRAIYAWWREIWLERVSTEATMDIPKKRASG